MPEPEDNNRITPGEALRDAFKQLTKEANTKIGRGITEAFSENKKILSNYLDTKSSDFKLAETATQTLLTSSTTLKEGLAGVSTKLDAASIIFTDLNTGILPQLTKSIENLGASSNQSETAAAALKAVSEKFIQPNTGILNRIDKQVKELGDASVKLEKGLGDATKELQQVSQDLIQPNTGIIGQLDKKVNALEDKRVSLGNATTELRKIAENFLHPDTGIIGQLGEKTQLLTNASTDLGTTTKELQKANQNFSSIIRELNDTLKTLKQFSLSNSRTGFAQTAVWLTAGLLISSGFFLLYAQRQHKSPTHDTNNDVAQKISKIREMIKEKNSQITDRERQQKEYWPRPWYSHISQLRDEAQLLRQQVAHLTIQEQLLVAGIASQVPQTSQILQVPQAPTENKNAASRPKL